ncbi:MAG: dTDP-4-dehydrorhamnose 3,5-epimerase [Thermodesulfovibrionia bacterium]
MSLRTIATGLPDIILIEPDVFYDRRGFFMETFHQERYKGIGINGSFVQDNLSHSKKGVLRGLHYQLRYPQAKLVYVISGEIFDVVVDIRRGSPTFGRWEGVVLSAENRRQIYIPEGFAHGFCVLSEYADVIYKCTNFYMPGDDFGILWSDPDIGIKWPIKEPILSEKDSKNPRIADITDGLLPLYRF